MNITITRQPSTASGTPGRLLVADAAGAHFTCATLELPWRDNRSGVSCILADTYRVSRWHSDHLGCDVLRLEDKHGRADCLVHPGNFAGDQALGLETQVHGCTLVGRSYGSLMNDDGRTQLALLDSRATLAQLLAFLGDGPHVIEYRWAAGAVPANVLKPVPSDASANGASALQAA